MRATFGLSENSEGRRESCKAKGATIVPQGPQARQANSSLAWANSRQRCLKSHCGNWIVEKLRLAVIGFSGGKFLLRISRLHFFVGVGWWCKRAGASRPSQPGDFQRLS